MDGAVKNLQTGGFKRKRQMKGVGHRSLIVSHILFILLPIYAFQAHLSNKYISYKRKNNIHIILVYLKPRYLLNKHKLTLTFTTTVQAANSAPQQPRRQAAHQRVPPP